MDSIDRTKIVAIVAGLMTRTRLTDINATTGVTVA